MSDFEQIVRPYVDQQTLPQTLIKNARYQPNVVISIGKNAGSGKILKGTFRKTTNYYRDHKEKEKSDS